MSFSRQFRQGTGRRGAGLLLALLAETLLVLLVLTLGSSLARKGDESPGATIVRFRSVNNEQQAQDQQKQQSQPHKSERALSQPQRPKTETAPKPVPEPTHAPVLPQMIRLSPKEMASANIASLPARPTPPAPDRGRWAR